MSDWELSAPNNETMQSLFQICEFAQKEGFTSAKVRYSVNYYGTKYIATGVTLTDANGMKYPEKTAQPGVYAVLRWIPPNVQLLAFPPSGVTLPAGVTAIALPASSPVKFF